MLQNKNHQLKILPWYFEAVLSEHKNFELRKDDRDFMTGDTLLLQEWDGKAYTGRWCQRKVTYVYRGTGEYGLAKGYCILGLSEV